MRYKSIAVTVLALAAAGCASSSTGSPSTTTAGSSTAASTTHPSSTGGSSPSTSASNSGGPTGSASSPGGNTSGVACKVITLDDVTGVFGGSVKQISAVPANNCGYSVTASAKYPSATNAVIGVLVMSTFTPVDQAVQTLGAKEVTGIGVPAWQVGGGGGVSAYHVDVENQDVAITLNGIGDQTQAQQAAVALAKAALSHT